MSTCEKTTADRIYPLLMALLGGEDALEARLYTILKSLTYREREIIKLRYGLGDGYQYTLEETARIFKVTRERIRQIEGKAIRKLRHHTRLELLVGITEQTSQQPQATDQSSPLSAEMPELLAQPIRTNQMSVRLRKCLSRLSVQTYGDLMVKSTDDLLEDKNMGETALQELQDHLQPLGLKLQDRLRI